jgi:4-amino-4-deoxy-L-arabinose transferase-like glycosyltransferase
MVASSAIDATVTPPFQRRRGFPVQPLAVALVIVAVAVLSLVTTHAFGGGIPQNDDWSYVKSALLLHRTGHIQLQGWGQMFLIGQLVTAQPFLWVFGNRTISLDIYGVVMTALWLSCAYLVGRRLVGATRAVVLVVALGLWPGMGLLSGSFQTDIPAYAVSLLCLLLGVRAVERGSRGWLVLFLVAGLWAFTIREQLVLAVVGPLAAVLLNRSSKPRFRRDVIVGIVVTAACCLMLEHLRHGLAHPDLPTFGIATLSLSSVPPTWLRVPSTVGFDLAPLVIWSLLSLRGRQWRDPGRVLGWLAGLLMLGAAVDWHVGFPNVHLSNYVSRIGGFGVAVVGPPPAVFSAALWHVVEVLSAVCGVALMGEIGARVPQLRERWRAARDGDVMLAAMVAYTLALTVFLTGLSFAGEQQFDVYLLPIYPGVGIMLLRRHRRVEPDAVQQASAAGRRRQPPVAAWAGLAAAVLLGYLGVVTTVQSDRRDHAAWDAATQLTRQGVPATSINAGLDWDGFHSPSAANRTVVEHDRYVGQHWTYIFAGTTDCHIVTFSPKLQPGWRLVRRRSLPGMTVAVYRRPSSCRRSATN